MILFGEELVEEIGYFRLNNFEVVEHFYKVRASLGDAGAPIPNRVHYLCWMSDVQYSFQVGIKLMRR